MTQEFLESPASIDEIYLAKSPGEVENARPYLTGDIFREVQIPGVESTGHGIVLTHPCSMRSDGVNLADKLLMASVVESNEIPLEKWRNGYYKVMPLPGFMDSHYSAMFDEIGLVRSELLKSTERLACLTPFGINLLQQRFIWYLTRFLAPTYRLDKATRTVLVEAELCEEWVIAVREGVGEEQEAMRKFHEWVRSRNEMGSSFQEILDEPQRRAGVRRAMQRHLSNVYERIQ